MAVSVAFDDTLIMAKNIKTTIVRACVCAGV